MRTRQTLWLILAAFLVPAMLLASKPKPENRWYHAGRNAHAQAKRMKGRARDQYCSSACRNAGARKAADVGACKEGCVFGS